MRLRQDFVDFREEEDGNCMGDCLEEVCWIIEGDGDHQRYYPKAICGLDFSDKLTALLAWKS